MTPPSFPQIEAALHTERLDAYRQDGADEKTALARYALNMALAEALYPSLQFAEIALRNAIHTSFTNRFGAENWYDGAAKLLPWQNTKVQEAKITLQKLRKPTSPGRIVAELSFGFWTGFFNKQHNRTGLSHHIAKTVFQHAPKAERNTTKLDLRWLAIRDLRNRVFHHERILHWKDLDLRHQHIATITRWICPELANYAKSLDRFDAVRAAGLVPWLKKIESL
ncbi:Abi family protein [Pelagicoccus sp. SDUM812005]|uniref:Abi family protein n=1 Tax=Pelagicoccus sp. SDUM812005 TaxID=3041257 RepID=UPI00280E123F|nr:Abi family protein [Pelagicoccus sp. SDUM812005]MDQ8180999.1 Abi family protein [Pelagicoccus sp. SDUM812005]